MVTKNQIKLITSLKQKKFRQEHQLFIAEGEKVISEFINARFELENLFVTESIFNEILEPKRTTISTVDLKKITCLSTPNNCLAVFKIPIQKIQEEAGLKLALDDIRDPGNLGTIIRLCDWFGVRELICSMETVDLYNPKVVQATMGSIARVTVIYVDLVSYLSKINLPIYGTFMDGKNVYCEKLLNNAILLLGNEGSGISKMVEKIVTHKIAIPRFGTLQKTESLNVASATAIFLSEFKRGF